MSVAPSSFKIWGDDAQRYFSRDMRDELNDWFVRFLLLGGQY